MRALSIKKKQKKTFTNFKNLQNMFASVCYYLFIIIAYTKKIINVIKIADPDPTETITFSVNKIVKEGELACSGIFILLSKGHLDIVIALTWSVCLWPDCVVHLVGGGQLLVQRPLARFSRQNCGKPLTAQPDGSQVGKQVHQKQTHLNKNNS
jgi:hypothetical protein